MSSVLELTHERHLASEMGSASSLITRESVGRHHSYIANVFCVVIEVRVHGQGHHADQFLQQSRQILLLLEPIV